jgi:hypothetical protein
MTQTTTLPKPRDLPPSGILLNLLVALLAPLFITATDGDISLARAAAHETIAGYRAQNHASLIMVARIIGFGLAALGSLSLSMADDLSIPLVLRLRGNANALNRSAERCERMLAEARTAEPPAPEPDEDYDEAEVRAAVAEAQRRTAAAIQPRPRAEPPAVQPAPVPQQPAQRAPIRAPAPPPAPVPAPAPKARPAGENPYPQMWAAAMAEVAAEEIAAAANLPPQQRKEATERAAILSDTANQLLAGATVPRPRPGDLAGMIPPPKR